MGGEEAIVPGWWIDRILVRIEVHCQLGEFLADRVALNCGQNPEKNNE